ncbi:surface-adhesin E family protein [Acinetobacter wuhouensis]|uniref:Surface-adhesin protein E-like domain-containing protein n=1 Tax=Acinetobacter wuhouensis TaxID=1879050 RepID=A0A4Q7ALB4_9GAMM|nr:surface-adhesin E family protein [Acinetobacter wuhouensis]RZG47042.1 hypothetical protein EXU28_07595 [Acinetobacter wuhouensis]
MKRLILICGFLASSFSFGADWRMLETSASGTKIYIDKESFKYTPYDGSVEIWVKGVRSSTEKTIDGSSEYKMLNTYFCKTRKMSTAYSVYYKADGSVINSGNINSGNAEIIPETISEGIFKHVCKNPKNGLEPLLHEFDTLEEFTEALKKFNDADYSKIDEKKYGKVPNWEDYPSIDDYVNALRKYRKKYEDDIKNKAP